MKTVGEIVRERREGLDLTLAAVAEEAGLTKSYLSMIENHKVENPPSRSALEALERALSIGKGELLRAADWQNTPSDLRDRLEKAEGQARRARELARWLKQSTSRRGDGAKSIDKLFTSGELARRVNAALRAGGSTDKDDRGSAAEGNQEKQARGVDARIPIRYRVPLINKVAAGYPKDFTDLDYPAKVADEYVACADVNDPLAFAARVIGESMLPEYREGDIVIFSPAAKVTEGSDCFVRLEPDHESTFKRVFFEKKAKGRTQIRLQPLNPKYPSSTYSRERVAGLYKAVWRMQRLGPK